MLVKAQWKKKKEKMEKELLLEEEVATKQENMS